MKTYCENLFGITLFRRLRARLRRKRYLARLALGLPDALDLWILIMQAGLDFQVAVKHYVESAAESPLRREMQLLQSEIQTGTPRVQALQNLCVRAPEPFLKETMQTIIQGIQLGSSLTPLLRSQSQSLRQKFTCQAEKRAAQAPIKMMIPLFLFIFPPILLVLIGPVLLTLQSGGLG